MPESATTRPIRIVGLLLALVAAVLLGGCFERNDDGLYEGQGPLSDEEKEEIDEHIAALANFQIMDRDPDAEAAYIEAKRELTMHGSTIEHILLESLAGSEEWGVRYGVIEVLDSVGTRQSVEPLIRRLADDHYLVALKAMYTVRNFTNHREIPIEGETEYGLPAVPELESTEISPDAQEEAWIAWHVQYGEILRDAWLKWWAGPGREVVVN